MTAREHGPPLSMRQWSRATRMRLHNPGTSNFDLPPSEPSTLLQPFSRLFQTTTPARASFELPFFYS